MFVGLKKVFYLCNRKNGDVEMLAESEIVFHLKNITKSKNYLFSIT